MIVSSSEKSDEIEKKVIQQLHIYYGEVWFKRMEAEWKLSTVTGTGLVHMVVHTSGSWDILDPLCFNSPPPPSPWNQHPPVHQLAVLSIHTMSCISSSSFWPCVNQHCTTVNLFWLLIVDLHPPLLFLGVFSQPCPYYPPTSLHYWLTCWPYLSTP